MTKSYLFLDVMARFQVGPVSLRIHGEQRDFVGSDQRSDLSAEWSKGRAEA